MTAYTTAAWRERAGTATAVCEDCGKTFERRPSEAWKRLCTPCWKAGVTRDAEDRAWHAGYEAGKRSAVPAEGLDKSRLRALLQLCHPDKHAGSDLATATTAWLLTIKARLQ